MGFEIIWSEAALTDLADICGYVAQHDPNGSGKGFSNTFVCSVRFRSSVRPIPDARAAHCERLFSL